MQDIDQHTEIFDLFGETGFCTVCQEDLVDGERVRVIQKCQHMYHQECIDPWLQEKGECPLCRASVLPQYTFSQSLIRLYDVIRAATHLPQYENLLAAAENLIETNTAMNQAEHLERCIISFCITDGILKRFVKAADYNTHRNEIEAALNASGTQLLPIDFTTHYALFRSKQTFKHEMCTRLNIRTRGEIRRDPRISQIRERLQADQRLAAIMSF